jgi:hypothetical protein
MKTCNITIEGFRENPISFEKVSYETTNTIFELIIEEMMKSD